ncbi:amino acid adenylation domain-containing protein [Thermoflavimicrobium daqui]|uniref:Non-ribosomal peptide synthetase n=1 Tax=Thermoflavimicrobium daqui TaxID=2137476 RepID=A0A364K7K4_9BACL|nr:non-ribosomal peptide synthetase [Thermoflavimicrobium daqui]RAL26258.1 non-ribosomal peptide synthetase [Thermoflavimicrobium daqui]
MMEEIQDIYTLSPLQQGLLFHSVYAENSGMYFTQMTVTIKGNLDVSAFEKAWQQVVNRHTILRTGFIWGETEQPLQVVYREAKIKISQLDWRLVPRDQLQPKLNSWLEQDRLQDFDLAVAPLMRLTLIQTAQNQYEFVWGYHHVLLDGWSLPIVLGEVFQYYEAFSKGKELELANPRPYRDYISWLRKQDVSQAEAFWREFLRGFTSPTPLGIQTEKTDETGYETTYCTLSKETTETLHQLARNHQITVNTIVQGAWALLLHRYSGESEVLFGTTVSGRPADLIGVEQMVGLFINTLPLRISMDHEDSILEWLKRLQARQVEMRQYEYSSLIDIHGWSEVPRGTPLFHSLFVYENYPVSEGKTTEQGEDELLLSNVRAVEQTNYPLTLVCAPGEELLLKMMYDRSQFTEEMVQEILKHVSYIVEQMGADLKQPLRQISLLTPADEQKILVKWNQTALDFPGNVMIHQLFEEQVARTPDQIAAIWGEKSLTYAELNQKANQCAHYLQSLGVGPEKMVGICMDRSLDLIIGILGTLKAGGAYVPLDPAYPKERIAYMLEDSQTSLLLTQSSLVSHLPTHSVQVICFDTDQDHMASMSSSNLENTGTSRQRSHIIYTSGSTGKPKGVMIEHRSVVALLMWASQVYSAEELQGVLASTSVCFDLSVFEMFLPLCVGGTVIVVENALQLPEIPAKEQVTLINTVPSAANELLRLKGIPSSVKVINLAGEPLPNSLAQQLYQLGNIEKVYNLYGPSEDTTYSTYSLVQKGATTQPTIGRPIANTEAYVLDAELRPVPIGISGELYLGGAGLARGYLNQPKLTAERFIPHPFRSKTKEWLYKTGDLVQWLPDGNLKFLGRLDHQVKIRGYRIELGEIEEGLRSHPAVEEVVVIAREDQLGEKRLVAYLVLNHTAEEISVSEWRSYLARTLPEYMIPSIFVQLEQLPLTPNGKIDRKALPAPEDSRQGEYVAPRTAMEKIVADIWASVLKIDQVGIHENFFERGGHSLLATQVISRLREAIPEREIPLRIVFEKPTVAAIANWLEESVEDQHKTKQVIPPTVRKNGMSAASYAQRRLWFVEQLITGSSAYSLPFAIRIQGEIKVKQLEQSFKTLITRHETLRTTFTEVDGEIMQVIADEIPWFLPVYDLTDEPNSLHRAKELIEQHAAHPFDLEQGPLLRASLFQLAEQDWVLFINMHHIISDGWSLQIFYQELFTLYQAQIQEKEISLPPLAVQYADFATWQKNWLQEEVMESQLAYWKEKLGGELPVLQLPTDRPRPLQQTFQGATHTIAFSANITERLKEISRNEEATLFMTLLAAFQVLLKRYSGQEDIIVGSPIAGRNRQELEGLIGFFVNTLAFRTNLSGNPTFRELLARVREVALEAYEHQDVPFEKVVDEVQPERSLSHSSLFQTMFVLQNMPFTMQSLEGLSLAPFDFTNQTAKYDLTLTMLETEQGLVAHFEYNTDLFDATTIERMAKHFQQLLAGIVQSPEQEISKLPILTEEEKELFYCWNQTQVTYPRHASIADVFTEQAATTPDHIAIVCGQDQITYRELNQRANQLARFLQKQGVGLETMVGIGMERSIELIIAMLGIAKAGGAYVPLDPTYPSERINYMMEDAGIKLVLTQSHLQTKFSLGSTHTWALDQQWELIEQESTADLAPLANGENLAYVMYTSGSTGKPKGVEVVHRGIVRLVRGANYVQLTADEVFLLLAPIAFDASTFEIWGSLLNGAKLIIMPSHAPSLEEIGQVLRQYKVTTLWLTVGLFNLMVENQLDALRGLRQLLVGGDVVSVPHVRKVLALGGIQVINGYGPTESTTFTCCYPIPADWQGETTIPIGRPISNTEVYILDQEGQSVPIGVSGELYIGGDGLARGYLGRPDLTRDRFVNHPTVKNPQARLYRTGDIVRYLPDGSIEFLGRIDHQVKIRGFRIELGEVEAAIRKHPTVSEVVVMVQHTEAGKRLVAYVVAECDQAELRTFLKESLPDYMIPTGFMFLEQIPLTHHGKIDRQALPTIDLASSREESYIAPRTEVEATLVRIWQDVLQIERIGIHDNFFSLGGDSILSIQIVSKAKQAGLSLTPKQIFEQQTIAELAQVVQQTTTTQAEQGLITGEVPLLPIQHWFFEQELPNPHHFNQAIMFSVHQPLKWENIQETVRQLLLHHDALRLRYQRHGETWKQIYEPMGDHIPAHYFNYQSVPKEQQREQIEQTANQIQMSLDLEKGPVFQVAYFDLGDEEPSRLLLVAHHLVIDGVSWRIILEDFQTIYSKLREGKKIQLPPKTSSVKEWAQILQTVAQSEGLKDECDYWKQQTDQIEEIPVDFKEGQNTEASAKYMHFTLSRAETQSLLQQVPTTLRSQIQEALLTALARAMTKWTQQPKLTLHLEGHGREDIVEGVDLSRTVGWFTSLYPICLKLKSNSTLLESLKMIKEQIRQVPQKGIGYGLLRYLTENQVNPLSEPRISFNYLGQFGQVEAEDSLFMGAPESVGQTINPAAQRAYLLEVTGMVSGGQLVITWKYSQEIHRSQTIEHVALQMMQELQAIIEQSEQPSVLIYTPSDFPLAKVNQAQLDQLLTKNASLENLYLATPLQQGMLFHSLYAQEKGDYITQIAFTLKGKVDPVAFEKAWQRLVDRHPILRTSFATANLIEPHQVVHSSVPVELYQLDWREMEPLEQQERFKKWLAEDRRQGFDFQRPPLMRWTLIRLADDVYRFLWTHHHILLDGWSISLVLKEVFANYFSDQNSQEVAFSESPSYEKYLHWLQKQSLTEAETYWKEKLKGFQTPTKIAFAKSTSKEIVPQREQRLSLPSAEMEALERFAKQHQLTVNTLVQGAWALVLGHLSNETDLLYGVTGSGRPTDLPHVESMVGLFISTLPMRIKLTGEKSILDWLHDLQREQIELTHYEYTPLVEIQKWSELPQGVPLFETLFIFENYPIQEVTTTDQGELEITDLYTNEQNNFPLTVVTGPGHELLIKVMYDPSYYEDASITRILHYLKTALQQIRHIPHAKLDEISILSQAEQQQILTAWNQPALRVDSKTTIPLLFTMQAERTPDKIAIEWKGQQVTYRELKERSTQLAQYLQRLGVGPETLVGVCMERNIDLIIAMMGILQAGGAYVPLDPHYPADRIAYMLQHSQAKVVITEEALLSRIPATDAHILTLDTEWAQITTAESVAQPLFHELTANHPAYVIYTSGSTGLPKGVVIEHRNVVALISWAHDEYAEEDLQGVLFTTSICFDLSVYELFVPLTMGGTVIIAENALELSSLETIQPITLINTVPSIMTEVLRVTTLPPTARIVNLCGEPLSQALVEKLYAIETVEKVYNLYGPTEDTVYSSVEVVDRNLQTAPPIGRPMRGTQMYVLDSRLQPTPLGVPGELYIAGAGLARGYLHQAELTAERFIDNPWSQEPNAKMYKTGDLVRWNENGVLEFIGRIDHQVKVRGFRIELGEIETILNQHERVQEAVVMVRDDHTGHKQLVAYLVLETKDILESSRWREYLQTKLPDYMIPSHFVILDAFPQTPNGKIDRKALPAPEMQQQIDKVVPPRTETERQLVQIWEEVLQTRSIGIHDSFFELGGHSLIALQIMSLIQVRLQKEISLATLFKAPTIEALAVHLESDEVALSQPLVLLNKGDNVEPPLFLIHPQGGGIWSFYELTQQLDSHLTIYGIQSVGYEAGERPLLTVEEMAIRYLEEMRQVQPQGPYRLAGWSMGGVIAFEITKQLEQSGEQVEWLGLIDSTWISDERRQAFRQFMLDPWVLREQAKLLQMDPESFYQEVSQVEMLTSEQLLYQLEEADLAKRKALIWLLNGFAYTNYQMNNSITSDIHLFLAEEKQLLQGNDDWTSFTKGEVRKRIISGNHLTIFESPYVNELAQQIRQSWHIHLATKK